MRVNGEHRRHRARFVRRQAWRRGRGWARGGVLRWAGRVVVCGVLVAGGAHCAHERPAGTVWSAAREPDSVAVGDGFVLRVDGLWPESSGPAHLAWGASPDSLLLVRRDSSRVSAADGWEARRYALTLIAPRAGRVGIPAAALVSARGETLALASVDPIRVGSRLAGSGERDLRPLAPLLSLRRFPWWVIGAGLLALLAAAFAWRRWRRRRLDEAAPAEPLLPPAEEFDLAVASLAARRLAEMGEMRAFAQELSWALRRYLGRRWDEPALEATRPEILRWLPRTRYCVRDQGRVASWLEETDRIKFAGAIPTLTRSAELLAEARALVGEAEAILAREAAAQAEAQRLATATGDAS
jgi:hypothetical protein